MLRRHLPNQTTDEPGFLAALQFFDRVLDVVERDHRNTDQTARRYLAVIDHPIIGNLETGFLKLRVFHGKEAQSERGIEDLRTNAVDFHLTDARFGVPTAGFLPG